MGIVGDRSPDQFSLSGNDEIEAPKVYGRSGDPCGVVAGHQVPNADENVQRPLLGVPIVGVLNKHQRVNLCMHILGLDSVQSGHKGYIGLG